MKLNKPFAIGALLLLPLCLLIRAELSESNAPVDVVIDDHAAAANVGTLGSVWREENARVNVETPTSQEQKEQQEQDFIDRQFSFDIHFMYEKLKQIELDESGHIALNDTTRRALEEGLEATGLLLTDYDLESLKDTVHGALAGELGLEVSALAVDFYNYLRAKEQVFGDKTMPGTLEGMKAHQAMLSDLRVATLGAERAKRLFGKSENDMNFMLESMALNQRTELTPEERAAHIRSLAEKYHQYEPAVEALQGQ